MARQWEAPVAGQQAAAGVNAPAGVKMEVAQHVVHTLLALQCKPRGTGGGSQHAMPDGLSSVADGAAGIPGDCACAHAPSPCRPPPALAPFLAPC
jgi:hypothetical protein